MARADANRSGNLRSLVHLVDAEFREMPGIRLTCAQAQRLWQMSPEQCRRVFDELVSAGRLERDAAGRYCARRSC